MTRQWLRAHPACDAAVRAADRSRVDLTPARVSTGADGDERLAAAYSDRTVMRWLSHDAAGARHDFARAKPLSPAASFVMHNTSALRSHGAPAPQITESLRNL